MIGDIAAFLCKALKKYQRWEDIRMGSGSFVPKQTEFLMEILNRKQYYAIACAIIYFVIV